MSLLRFSREIRKVINTRSFSSAFADARTGAVALTFKAVRPCAPIESPAGARSVSVAVVGAPNAGKSTLVNALLGGVKVSSVSSKYNTTRGRVLGVFRSGTTEVVLTDTPGFIKEGEAVGRKYEPELVNAAVQAIPSADVVLLVVDVARRWDADQRSAYGAMLHLAASNGCLPIVLANKADLVKGARMDAQQQSLAQELHAAESLRHACRAPTDILGLKRSVLWKWMEEECVQAGMLVPRESERQQQRREEEGKVTGKLDWKDEPAWGLLGSCIWLPRSDAMSALSVSAEAPPFIQLPNLYHAARVHPVMPLSAAGSASGTGIQSLRDALLRLAVPRHWQYAPSQGATDSSALELLTLAVREPLFEALHGDVPYKVRLAVREWRVEAGEGAAVNRPTLGFLADLPDSSETAIGIPLPANTELAGRERVLRVSVDLRVPTRGVASMLTGRQGSSVRNVARQASATLQAMLDGARSGQYPSLAPFAGCRVKLDLHVAIKDSAGDKDRAARTRHEDGSVGQAAMLE